MYQGRKVPKRVAQAVISSLKGGVVPRIGLPYITVGRASEIEALLRDVEVIGEGGASFRFIVGRYGSGKSFLLQTIRNNVMDKGFVVMDADLSPERRLQGTRGQGLATYRELIGNLATKTKPEGGALTLVLERWIGAIQSQVLEEGSATPDPADSPETGGAGEAGVLSSFDRAVEHRIREVIRSLSEMVHGFDFARLITLYYRGYLADDDEIRARVLKWFRGEYATRTEAKKELGVNAIITDDDWYEYLKLFAMFFRLAGYKGMLIFIDELVNIYKIPQSIARNNNYEKILTMYNDTLQGKAQYLGILMSGTPQCVEDTRRGIYSYEALRSRLQEGKFSKEGTRDLLSPVIRLEPLSSEEMMVLCEKLADMHAGLYGCPRTVQTGDLVTFIRIEYGRIGADTHITPREVIRDFIELLDILYQHPDTDVAQLLGSDEFSYAQSEAIAGEAADEEYADFVL
ncbi:MAG TPA: biotin carboxylase [Lachnospiraceae bacterium]|nr:biotin carboxylase [Lachnospiraceae bacterium]